MLSIIINNGSTSKRYGLFKGQEKLFEVYYENTPEGYLKSEYEYGNEKQTKIDKKIFNHSFDDLIKTLLMNNLIKSEDDINRVGVRVVAPGRYFQEHQKIDKIFLEKLDDRYNLSPLHIKPVQEEIANVFRVLPNVEKYAISDSSFHKDKPDYADVYAYPLALTEDLELYRFGYHGISYSSIVDRLQKTKRMVSKLIVCHLGGGSSVSAIKDGKSIDTSMGYSPLEGLPMATRIGTADPNTMIAVMQEKNLYPMELQDFLYHQCGVKGISQTNGDTREILKMSQQGDIKSELALNVYTYQIAKYIGAYTTILGGLEMLVFTGTIGNRSADIRQRVCRQIEYCGAKIDLSKNKLTFKIEQEISQKDSGVKILVMSTDEIGEMARILNSL